ncbi:MAG: aminotransferase class I/II-fold pyridoxal phosphate-dependent enzyme [Oscillospiraceae bacterium]
MRKNSLLIHGGVDGDARTGAVNVPIYQTATYKQPEFGRHSGYEYSRTGNPTREALEALIADLEEGTHGLAFASGMAATTAVLSLFETGDRIVISSNVYGGTFRVLDQIFNRFGLTYTIADTTDRQALSDAITPDVKAVLVETPANPLLTVTDLRAVAEVTRAKGVLLIVDNTFMTPYLQRPLTLGADIVLHSATKYLAGHSDVVAGLAVVKDEALAKRLYFIQNATGGVLAPFDSFLVIRGIKTLGVRLDRHNENALFVANQLKSAGGIANVYYPGLPDDPGYAIQRAQADGAGGVISFELAQGYSVPAFYNALSLVTLAESLGGVESLACHPSTMTHASIPAEIREKVGITERLVRISVGIEDAQDILDDLLSAVAQSKEG